MSKYQSSIVTNQGDVEDLSKALLVYYCLCGEYALIIEKNLAKLPVRPTDNSTIIDNTKYIYSLSPKKGQPVIIQRAEKFEKQYRYYCTRCRLPIAYDTIQIEASYHSSTNANSSSNTRYHRNSRVDKHDRKAPFTYLLPGSLVLKQGEIPQEFIHELDNIRSST